MPFRFRRKLEVPAKSRPWMLALEPRIVLDAASVETVTDVVHDQIHKDLADRFVKGVLTNGKSLVEPPAVSPFLSAFADDAETQEPTASTDQIIFLSQDVADPNEFLKHLPENAEVVILDQHRDGIEQIAQILSSRSGLDAIHIIGHGDEGSISLGGGTLDHQSMLGEHYDDLAIIGDALTEFGDILIYGCDFAGGEVGLEAVETLAQLTGADIAASIDVTGHADLGGDWHLEHEQGAIEAAAISAGENWFHTLGGSLYELSESGFGSIDDNGISSSEHIGQTFRHNTGGGDYTVNRVDVVVEHKSGYPLGDVTVQIRDGWNGPVVATGTIDSGDLTNNYKWHIVYLDSPVDLTSNYEYTLRLISSSGSNGINVASADNTGYSNGHKVKKDGATEPGKDLFFRIIEDSGNTDPWIASDGGGPTAYLTMDENQTLVTTVDGQDADLPGDDLYYSIIGSDDDNRFEIDQDTGVLTFKTAPNFEAPTDGNVDNIYRVTVQVDDGIWGGSDTQIIDVEIQDVNDRPVATGGDNLVDHNGSVVIPESKFGFTDDEGHALQSVTITNLNLAGGTLTHTGGTVTVTNGMTLSPAQLVDLTFTPALNILTDVTFDYTVNDADLGIVSAQMKVCIAHSELYESHQAGYPTIDRVVAMGSSQNVGQTFTHNSDCSDYKVDRIDLVLRLWDGAPTQDVTVQIRDSWNGTILASGTLPGSQLDNDWEWRRIMLDSPVVLNDNQQYTIRVTSSDTANDIEVAYEDDVGYSGGTRIIHNGNTHGGSDLLFNVLYTGQNTDPTVTSHAGAATVGLNMNENETAVTTVAATDTDVPVNTVTYKLAKTGDYERFSINETSGDLTFNPAANFEAPTDDDLDNDYHVTVIADDFWGGTDTQSFDITIEDVNDPPVATGGVVLPTEDIPYVFSTGDFNYADEEGDALQSITISNLSLAGGTLTHTGGTVTVTNGMTITAAEIADLTFTPALNSTTSASFDYTVNDADPGVIAAGMNMFITAINDVPVATGGGVMTGVNTPVVINAGDFPFTDVEGDGLQSITISNLNLAGGTLTHTGGTVTVTTGMTVTAAEIADLTYTPALDSVADASFDYAVNDNDPGVVTASMGLCVTHPQVWESHEIPFPDIDHDELISSSENIGQTFSNAAVCPTYSLDRVDLVLMIDAGEPLQDVIVTIRDSFNGPILATGTLSGSELETSFSWQNIYLDSAVILNSGQSYVIQVSTTNTDKEVRIGVDHDVGYPNGDALDKNGDIWSGHDILFKLIDTTGNTDPLITSDGGLPTAYLTVDENQTGVTTVAASDTDIPINTLTYSIVAGDDGDEFDIDPVSGVLTFKTAPNFDTPTDDNLDNVYRVTVEVQDEWGGTDTQIIDVEVQDVNETPVATGGSVTTDEDVPHVFVAGEFSYTDAEGDGLQSITISNLSLAGGTLTHTGGTVTVTNGMTVTAAEIADLTFTPAANSSAPASFDYTVNDADPGVVAAAMSITVNAVNDVPVATGGAVATNEDVDHVFAVGEFNFTDAEGDGLQSITISNLSLAGGAMTHTGGTVTVTNGMTVTAAEIADLTFTPAANSSAPASFDYTVNDADPGVVAAAMSITVDAVNDVPVATGGAVATNEDVPHVFAAGEFNFTDVEVDALQSITVSNLNLAGGTLTHTGGTVTVTNGMTVTAAEIADLTFTPAANSSASASFDYAVNDADPGVVTAAMSITVNPVNDEPVATGGAVATNEDVPHVFAVGEFNFTDVESDGLQSITISNLNLVGGTLTHTGGTVTVTNGMTVTAAEIADLTFNPALGVTLPASFDYTVNDADPGSVAAAMSVTVNPANNPPVATGGAVATNEDTSHVFTDGEFNFTDAEGDGLQSITISNLNLAGGTLTHTGGTVTVTNGMTVTAAEIADLALTPAANSTTPVSFDYAVNDANPGVVTAAMSVTVNAVNDVPLATGGAVATNEDVPHTFAAGEFNYTDVEGDGLQSITISNLSLAGGTLTHTGGTVTVINGMTVTAAEIADLTFTPAANSSVPASFDYTVNDADPGAVAAAMSITVNAVNDLPMATGGAVVTNEDAPHVFVAGEFNFTDVEGDGLQSITISNLSLAGGTLTHTGGTVTVTNGMTVTALEIADLTFTPAANSSAPASFDYTVNDADPGVLTAAMSITVNPINDEPVATGGAVATDEDVPHVFAVGEFNFTDVEGDGLQSITISNLNLAGGTLTHTGGTVTVTNGMTITAAEIADLTFTPAANSSAPASFDYTVNDADPGVVSAAMSITVNDVNDAPVAGPMTDLTGTDSQPVFADISGDFTDIEGDTITFAAAGLPPGLSINPTTGEITGTLDSSASVGSPHTVSITATDVHGDSAMANFTWTVTNPSPTANPDSFFGVEDVAISGSVALNDLDIDGDGLNFILETAATKGTVSVLADGSFTYTPGANQNGIDTFQYRVTDDDGGMAIGTATLTLAPMNDLPVAVDVDLDTHDDAPLLLGAGAFSFTDPDGDPLAAVTMTGLNLHGGYLAYAGGASLVSDGDTLSAAQVADLQYVPAAGETAPATFSFSVNDGIGNGSLASVTVNNNQTSPYVPDGGGEPPEVPTLTGGGVEDPVPETEIEIPIGEVPEPEIPITKPPNVVAPTPTNTFVPTAPNPDATPYQPPAEPEAEVEVLPVAPAASEPEKPTIEPSPVAVEPPPKPTLASISWPAFEQELDRVGSDVRRYDEFFGADAAKVTFAFGSLLSVGGVSFILRTGVLATALLTALPAWTRFDPIAVVSSKRDEEEPEEQSDVDMMTQFVREAQSRVKQESMI